MKIEWKYNTQYDFDFKIIFLGSVIKFVRLLWSQSEKISKKWMNQEISTHTL